MSLPVTDRSLVRDALFGVAFVVLLVAPVVLGFRIAKADVTQAPEPGEIALLPSGAGPSGASDLPQVVEDRPLGDAPGSTEDALTRNTGDASGIPRLTFIADNDDHFSIDSGETVRLGDGVAVTVIIDPFPPTRFDVGVEYEFTRDGEPITDAIVDTSWDMTFMRHGPFDTRLDPLDGGWYAADYDFFMFGPWQLDTVATIQDDQYEFAVSVYVWPN
jgi:hypothetical protein